jgi:hypothetical protein
MVLTTSIAGASAPQGPVTIVTAVDFSDFPIEGTFIVTVGADTLGCSSGTFVDAPFGFSVRKEFTCSSGGTGKFTANFQPLPKPGPGDANGQWNIVEATGDFAGLRGSGDFSVVFPTDCPPSCIGTETFTGKVHFH